jgi:hypothetical protein
VVGAQRALLMALDFRAEALKEIADQVPNALGTDDAASATAAIAAEMQVLLASDVIYAERVVPLVEEALARYKLHEPVTASQFLPSLDWLSPQFVTAKLTGNAGGTTASGTPKPGTHGHALLSVSVNGTALTPGTALNQIKVTPNLTFDLLVANQGTNDETGVQVSLKIEEGTSTPTLTKTIDTKAGVVQHVLIPLTTPPPSGNVRLVASVAPVPGEVTTSNNHLSFLATFTH